MGLFSGSRRSSSSTTSTVNNVDNSNEVFEDINGSAVSIDGNGNNQITIVETDNEAIESSFEFAEGVASDAFLFAGFAQHKANDLVENAIEDSNSATKSAIDKVSSLLTGQQKGSVQDIKNIVIVIVIALAVIFSVIAFTRSK